MIQSGEQSDNIEPSFPEELRERYDEVRFVGKGGMGRVYFAHDIRLNRFVAIKLLPHTADNASSIVRFHQEARAISKLNNPHVVQVLDFGSTDDSDFFLVMEYINGQDLEDIVTKNGPIAVRKAIDIAIQVCTALEHAHAHGIVHRDLKPANIMIDQENHARILDFGVAKIVNQEDTDHRLTRPGQAVGSVMYMSPEQLRGEEADHRSDVYSAGLMIYKMIAGLLPHENEKIMKIIKLRLEEPPPALPLQNVDREVILKLNKVLALALANKSVDRFDSMTALKSALSECLSTQTPQLSVNPRTKKTIGVTALAAIVCVLVVGANLIAGQNSTSKKAHKKAALPAEQTKVPAIGKSRQSPLEKSSQGTWLPPGFSEDNDNGQLYWVAHDYVTNEDLKRLIGSDVPNLSLQDNQNITDDGIKNISTLKINALSLRDTRIGDNSIEYINRMNLRNLSLRHSLVTEEGVLRLKPSTKMFSLDLKYLPIRKKGLDYVVKNFPNLISINIGETGITNADLDEIKRMPNLACLYIEGIGLKDSALEKLARIDKITKYEVAANPITDASIGYLLKKPALEWVSFGACEHISEGAIKRLQSHFPKGKFDQPVAVEPPEDVKGLFFKEYE